MSKVTTAVEVKVVIELSVEEAKALRDELGENTNKHGTYQLFDKLDDVLNTLPVKGVE